MIEDPTTKRIWCRSSRYTAGGNSRKYIVIHNTANTATAVQEANNLKNNNGSSSFQYAVDDVDIVQCVHDYDTAWAVGAWSGTKAYITNSQSISIEVCNPGTEFSEASKRNLRALVRHLMDYYDIPADHVVRHWDCHSGRKQCPKFYSGANNAAWNELHAYITDGTQSEEDDMPAPIDIWAYKNAEVNGDKDAYQLLTEISRSVGAGGANNLSAWNYKNTEVNGDLDAYYILYDARNRLIQMQTTVEAMSAAIEALAKANGIDPDAIAKTVSDAVAKKLESIDLTVTVDE